MSKVSIGQVQIGMILGEAIFHPESKKLLLKQGSRLTKENIEKLVVMNCKEVEISDRFTVFLDIRENMESLLQSCYDSMLKKVASKYPEGNMNDEVMEFTAIVKKLVKTICSDKTVDEICVDMQVVDFEALVRASVFASGYAMLVAAVMRMSEKEILNVGIAGLIHNVGMCEMRQLIREKEIPEINRALYEEHPTYGYYMMVEKNISREIAELIYAHHEKYDGTGFPRQLKGDDIPLGAQIIALCSDYEELISVKRYRHYEAMEYIYGNSGISYNPAVVEAFTTNIPVYPMGAVVQLSTGDIGVVVNIRKNKGPRPVIRIQYNRVYKPVSHPKLVDLEEEKTVFIDKIISY